MRQLWLFLSKFHIAFLFLFLEAIGFGLLFSRSNYQRAKFLKSTSVLQAGVANKRSGVTDFYQLKDKNKQLAFENQQLREQVEQLKTVRTLDTLAVDSITQSNYLFTAAKVITNKMNGSNNHITINKGSKKGVKVGNAAMTAGGLVGKVVQVNKNYALVMPLFNTNVRFNVQHKASEYNGDLVWSGANFETVQVQNISRNAKVEVGDTITTNQFSKSIPEGTAVGIVTQADFDLSGNFYNLSVKPTAEFRRLNYVYIVERKDIEEINTLESQNE